MWCNCPKGKRGGVGRRLVWGPGTGSVEPGQQARVWACVWGEGEEVAGSAVWCEGRQGQRQVKGMGVFKMAYIKAMSNANRKPQT